jgi:hypothetical protein
MRSLRRGGFLRPSPPVASQGAPQDYSQEEQATARRCPVVASATRNQPLRPEGSGPAEPPPAWRLGSPQPGGFIPPATALRLLGLPAAPAEAAVGEGPEGGGGTPRSRGGGTRRQAVELHVEGGIQEVTARGGHGQVHAPSLGISSDRNTGGLPLCRTGMGGEGRLPHPNFAGVGLAASWPGCPSERQGPDIRMGICMLQHIRTHKCFNASLIAAAATNAATMVIGAAPAPPR